MGRTRIGRIKLTCRITPKAMQRLNEEADKIRSSKPMYGELLSRLITRCPTEFWAKIEEGLPLEMWAKQKAGKLRRIREEMETWGKPFVE